MWIIKNTNTGQLFHLIPEKRKYVVGRTGADIILKDDTSISRTHAILEFQDCNSLTLTDCGSKYGSFLNNGIANNKKISANEKVELHDGDNIRYGLLKNEWVVSKFPLKSMTSSLPANKANELEQQLTKLGGTLASHWEIDCTHLTMSEITVTVKVLYALLGNVPIVLCEYWKDFLAAARKGHTDLPRPELYLPKKSNLLMNNDLDFGLLPNRKCLFSGKIFVFMNKKHFDTYGPIVQMAGGACRNLNNGVPKSMLTMANVVVIQYVPSTQSQSTQTINSISDYLESNSRRIIPEYEIGLAIVHCSIEKYCNPTYKINSNFLPSTSSMTCEELELDATENNRGVNACNNSESDLEVPETDCTAVDIEKRGNNDSNPHVVEQSEAMLESDKSHLVLNDKTDEEYQNKRKRPSSKNINFNDDDGNSDEDFVQAVKRPKNRRIEDDQFKEKEPTCNSENNAKQKRTLPIVVNDRKAKVSTAGFLNKTQNNATQKECETSSPGKKLKETSKRGRIALITDEDSDDENDLFNFGSSAKTNVESKKRRIEDNHIASSEDSDDELFAFSKPSAGSENESEDLEPTQEFIAKENTNKTTVNPIKQPKMIPQKVNTSGWLTSSLSKLNIKQLKDEEEISKKDESNSFSSERETHKLDDDSVEDKKCLMLVSGFDVRFTAIPKKCKEKLQNSKCNHNNSKVNFKVFVKKCNYKPQNQVIKCNRSLC